MRQRSLRPVRRCMRIPAEKERFRVVSAVTDACYCCGWRTRNQRCSSFVESEVFKTHDQPLLCFQSNPVDRLPGRKRSKRFQRSLKFWSSALPAAAFWTPSDLPSSISGYAWSPSSNQEARQSVLRWRRSGQTDDFFSWRRALRTAPKANSGLSNISAFHGSIHLQAACHVAVTERK
jgi:hypothetical protein